MAYKPSAVRNGLWNALATGILSGVGIIGSILIVRSLSPSEYGVFSYYSWLAGLLGVLGILAFPKALTKIAAELRGRGAFAEAVALTHGVGRALVGFNLLVGIAILIWALNSDMPQRTYLLIIAVVPIFHTLLRVLISTFWGNEHYFPVSVATAVPALIQLGLVYCVLVFDWGVAGFLAAVLSVNVSGAIILIAFYVYNMSKNRPTTTARPSPETFTRYLKFATPATLAILVDAVVWQRSEVFFLERLSTLEQVGIYSLAYSIFTIFSIVGLALVNGFYPSISHDYGAGKWAQIEQKIGKAVLLAALFAVPISLGGWVTLGELVPLLYQDKMLPAVPVAHVLLVGLLFAILAEVFSITLAALDRLWLVVRLGLVTAGVNIVLNLLLIPPLGAYGGAIGNAIAQLSYSVVALFLLGRVCRLSLPWRALGGLVLIAVVSTLFLPMLLLTLLPGVFGLAATIVISGFCYLAVIWRSGVLNLLIDTERPAGKLRILHILGNRRLPRHPDSEGTSGVIRAALEIARAQAALGHEVTVATVTSEAWTAEWCGVTLSSLRAWPGRLVQLERLGNRVLNFQTHLPYVFLTHRHRFDIAQGHSHNYMRFVRAGARIVHFHGDPFIETVGIGSASLTKRDLMRVSQSSHALVAVSHFVAKQLYRAFGSQPRIRVVHNGVNPPNSNLETRQMSRDRLRRNWGLNEDDTLFLYAGAIVPEKGAIELARAFVSLAEEDPKAHLLVAGSSTLWSQGLLGKDPHQDYEAEVRRILDLSRQRGRTHFVGVVPMEEMPALYVASDAIIMPSIVGEGFGLVALEALAAGRPVIASNKGGLTEVVDETCGILVPAGDEGALQRAMSTLVRQGDLRLQLSKNAMTKAQRFSWTVAAHELDLLYASVLAGGDRHVPANLADVVPQ